LKDVDTRRDATTPLRVLVVDDSEDYVELCHEFLQRYTYLTNCDFTHPCWECELRPDCRLKHAHDWDEVKEILERHGGEVDTVLLDIEFELPVDRLLPVSDRDEARGNRSRLKRLQARQGLHILEALRTEYGSLPVVLMTSKNSIAHDDPALFSQLREHRFTEMLGDEGVNAQSLAARIESFARLRHRPHSSGRFFWGQTDAMAQLRSWLDVFSDGDQPILLLGETGTGKSYLARHVIHPAARPRGPFCALDLAAIPENLIPAELFGTSRGAFSDAVDRPGRFEFAKGGTLFLDEIGNLSPETQKRLLGVIQDRTVTRLGENRARPIDVRLVVATNEDLEEQVRDGSFRADLYQRLNPAARVVIPPLRERMDDLAGLLQVVTEHMFESPGNRRMLARYAAMFDRSDRLGVDVVVGKRRQPSEKVVLQLAGAAEKTVRAANWPGNVRQLESVWMNAVTFQMAEQIAAGRVSDDPVIALDPQLLGELIRSSSVGEDLQPDPLESEPEHVMVSITPGASLNAVSREVEAQYFRELYIRGGEDFERMARRLLSGDPLKNARRTQLRFNNLGLSARKLRRKS
jgi:two-component system nitrogen regulation response regulator GlnG